MTTTERAGILLVAAAAALSACAGCAGLRGASRHDVPRDDACTLLDSALTHSGLHSQVSMRGRVTIDVNQYRVRGRFVMALTPDGDLTFDITSTTMIGGHREDAVLSFFADTLRVLDRERGCFYEGEDVDALVAEEAPVDLGELLRLATGRAPACRRIREVSVSRGVGRLEVDGRLDGHGFELRFERGRIARSVWPLPLSGSGRRDDVETEYVWSGEQLDRLTVYVPERRWRVRLVAGSD